MKYACLVYVEAATMMQLSEADGATLTDASINYDLELSRGGNMIAAEALQAPESAMTIRVRNGKASHVDGPFAETKEFLAGFILIEARDFNDAVRIAEGIPMAGYGSVEVRPIMALQHSEGGEQP